MAISETVRDIENNPSKSKTVTLDLQSIVPLDNDGDEVYVISASSTNAKVGGGTANPIYVREFKAGYVRSSGLKSAPFTITTSNNTLRISLDGSTVQTITLTSGTGLTGSSVASDLETQIRALAGTGQAEDGNLAFLNATVEFINNKFLIVSGSISNTYVGVGKSSVQILAGLSNDATGDLGLDIVASSEVISGLQATETSLTASYSAGGATLTVGSTATMSSGHAFMITDGTNKEYFVASGLSSSTMTISGSGLANDYGEGTLVQHIFERDPDAAMASPYDTVDSITRFALRSIASQLDFTV